MVGLGVCVRWTTHLKGHARLEASYRSEEAHIVPAAVTSTPPLTRYSCTGRAKKWGQRLGDLRCQARRSEDGCARCHIIGLYLGTAHTGPERSCSDTLHACLVQTHFHTVTATPHRLLETARGFQAGIKDLFRTVCTRRARSCL
eukprot:3938599-Rhodomonas_salina.2